MRADGGKGGVDERARFAEHHAQTGARPPRSHRDGGLFSPPWTLALALLLATHRGFEMRALQWLTTLCVLCALGACSGASPPSVTTFFEAGTGCTCSGPVRVTLVGGSAAVPGIGDKLELELAHAYYGVGVVSQNGAQPFEELADYLTLIARPVANLPCDVDADPFQYLQRASGYFFDVINVRDRDQRLAGSGRVGDFLFDLGADARICVQQFPVEAGESVGNPAHGVTAPLVACLGGSVKVDYKEVGTIAGTLRAQHCLALDEELVY